MTVLVRINYFRFILLMSGFATVLSNPIEESHHYKYEYNKRSSSSMSVSSSTSFKSSISGSFMDEQVEKIRQQSKDILKEHRERLAEQIHSVREITSPFGNNLQLSRLPTDCGRILIPLIQDGEEANPSEHPWNAAIYRLKKSVMALFCGGTLISPYWVLSAAHCFYIDNIFQNSDDAKNKLKIVLGKKYLRYNHPSDSENVQYIDVLNINVPDTYEGVTTRYATDIALIELKTPADINEFVLPVCIDRASDHELKNNMMGKVVGWGKSSKEGRQTLTLQMAEIPYVSYDECSNSMYSKHQNPIPRDKFCTTIEGKGNALQNGDSGAGFIFQFGERAYIYGIVSAAISDNVTVLTDLRKRKHLSFIGNTMKKNNQN